MTCRPITRPPSPRPRRTPGSTPVGRGKAFDASSLAPARHPTEYQMCSGDMLAPIGAGDAAMRGALYSMEIPATVGGSLAEIGAKSSLAFDRLDANGKEMWQAEQRSQLSKMYPDVAAEMAKVDALVAKADPEVAKALAEHGFFNATVCALLITHANRMAARQAMGS